MSPDVVIVFPAGSVPLEGGGFRSTTYEDGDAFGTLGGRDRIQAGAILAATYPNAHFVTTSIVYTNELVALGVAKDRFLEEGLSSNTKDTVFAVLDLAQKRGYKNLLFVSSEFHIPRIKAFYEQAKSQIEGTFVSSESVLTQHDPAFAEYFEKVKKSPDYEKRLAAEQRGIEAIKQGIYQSAPLEDKRERSV